MTITNGGGATGIGNAAGVITGATGATGSTVYIGNAAGVSTAPYGNFSTMGIIHLSASDFLHSFTEV